MIQQEYHWYRRNRLIVCSSLASIVMMLGVAVMGQVVTRKTSYVYVPGLCGSPVVIGRYCPYYIAPTGEEIHGTQGGSVLGDGMAISPVVFPEIDIEKPSHWFRRLITPYIARNVLFSFFGIVVKENSYTSQTFLNYFPDIRRANIGQGADIEALRTCLREHIKKFPGTKIVIFGDSRGAATTFNLLALDHPPVACAILEGIFDSIPHLIKHCWRWRSKHDSIERALHAGLKACTSCYNPEGPFPVDYVDRIPLDIPLLLVTSLCDEIVPYQSTMRLYCHLVERGHKQVHLLVLEHASHKGYMISKDRKMYESCVHAFYQAYGVAYEERKADQGQELFTTTQPLPEEVRSKYSLSKPCCQ